MKKLLLFLLFLPMINAINITLDYPREIFTNQEFDVQVDLLNLFPLQVLQLECLKIFYIF